MKYRDIVLYKFRTEFFKQSPDRRTIQKKHATFKKEGCLCYSTRIAPSPSTETIQEFETLSNGEPQEVNQKS